MTGFFDELLESWLSPGGQTIQTMQFYETNKPRSFERGAKWQVMPSGGPLGLRAAYSGKAIEDSWGANFHRSIRKRLGRSLEWAIIAEDLSDESNRVVLDSKLTDSDGIPSPKVIYKNSDNTRKMIDFHLERAKEATLAAGAYHITVTPLMRDCGWHLMGAARMGNDPESSVATNMVSRTTCRTCSFTMAACS